MSCTGAVSFTMRLPLGEVDEELNAARDADHV
jgi:hypothetical protein